MCWDNTETFEEAYAHHAGTPFGRVLIFIAQAVCVLAALAVGLYVGFWAYVLVAILMSILVAMIPNGPQVWYWTGTVFAIWIPVYFTYKAVVWVRSWGNPEDDDV